MASRALFFTSLLLSAPALADPVDVSVQTMGKVGGSRPHVRLQVNAPIDGFSVVLKADDGRRVTEHGLARPGQSRVVELPALPGKHRWQGEVAVSTGSGTASLPLDFETLVVGPLKLSLDKDRDVDLEARRIRFSVSNPAARAELKVLMDSGTTAFDGEVPLHEAAPGTPLEVSWPAGSGKVMQIRLTVYDVAGYYTGVELTPWEVDIPHQDVNFDSGKAELKPAEAAKLDEPLRLIAQAVERYGHLAPLALYVAGHTDTVGPGAANRALSLSRARTLALHLRRAGLKLPLFVEGFGEDALAVPTPDETDEPRNRRAEYIIAISEPASSAARGARWKRL